jgi:heme exporter protein A
MLNFQVDDISYSIDDRIIFAPVSFKLQAGDLLQVVGKNGAGKTSLLRTLVGLAQPSGGTISWLGKAPNEDPLSFQQALFYLGHQTGLKKDLTVIENILFDVRFIGTDKKKAEAALKNMELFSFRDKLTGTLSRGQQQKVILVKMLLTQAPLLILDEPFTALDTDAMDYVQDLLRKKLEGQHMVIMTSHRALTHARLKVNTIILSEKL